MSDVEKQGPPYASRFDAGHVEPDIAGGSDGDLRLAPTDPDVDAARRRGGSRTPSPASIRLEHDHPREPFQFSLMQMLIANTLVAIMLALVQIFAPSLVAGTLGILMLAWGLYILDEQPNHPFYTYGWFAVLLLYAVMSAVAIAHG